MQGFGDIAVISIEHLNSYYMKTVILKVGLIFLAFLENNIYFCGSNCFT